METELLNQRERSKVLDLIGKGITNLSDALAIAIKAQERVVNGSVNVTVQFNLRNSIEQANKAARQIYVKEEV